MSAELQTPIRPNKLPRYRHCIPSGGKHPGEEHQALLSWIENDVVVISVRRRQIK